MQLTAIFIVLSGLWSLTPVMAQGRPEKPKPRPNAALTLIYIQGDPVAGFKAGDISSGCIGKDTGASDQYEVLQSRIIENPYDSTYVDNAYITKSSFSRAPIFQVRFPDPRYCKPFANAYDSCYEKHRKTPPKDDALQDATLACIKEGVKKAKIKENWKNLMDEALAFIAEQKAEAAKASAGAAKEKDATTPPDHVKSSAGEDKTKASK